MNRHIGMLLTLVLFVSGCSVGMKKVVLEPSDLQGKGLLVARIDATRYGNFSIVSFGGDVYISGKKYADQMYYHYLVLPLKPGKYDLEKIVTLTGLDMPGTYMLRRYSHFTISRSFTIKEGTVTNLGFIVAHFPTDNEEQYALYAIDNSKQMAAYLKREQPAAYQSLRNKKIQLAKADYLSKSQINALRKQVAIQSANKDDFKNRKIAWGALGTVARVKKNDKRISRVQLLKTGTLDTVSNCSENSYQFACIIQQDNKKKLLVGRLNGKYSFKPFPKTIDTAKLFVFGKQNILLADDSFNLYESNDGGKSFVMNSSFKLTEPDEGMRYIRFYRGKNGFYLAAIKRNGHLLYKPYNKSFVYKALPVPEGGQPSDVYETRKGIVMGPNPGITTSSEVYYMLNGSNNWVEVTIPSAMCVDIQVLNYHTGKLKMSCGMREGGMHYYMSNDAGMSWTKT